MARYRRRRRGSSIRTRRIRCSNGSPTRPSSTIGRSRKPRWTGWHLPFGPHPRSGVEHVECGERMSEVTLLPVDPTPDEVQFLEDRIYEFNSSTTGITGGELLAFFVRDGDHIVAGLCGNTWGGTCELRQFWVEESQRRRGLGTRLFHAAEQEARRRGCTQIVLMTFSFQAPSFYERHGFKVFATIEDHPRGHLNLLMRKHLAPD